MLIDLGENLGVKIIRYPEAGLPERVEFVFQIRHTCLRSAKQDTDYTCDWEVVSAGDTSSVLLVK